MRSDCTPQTNQFGNTGVHMCSSLDLRTKCAILPSIIHDIPSDYADRPRELDSIINPRIKARNPIDFLWMGPVGLFRRSMDILSTLGTFVYDGLGFSGVVVGSNIVVTVPLLSVPGAFLGYHVVMTGQLRAASSNLITYTNTATFSVLDLGPTSRQAALTIGILSEQTFFVPLGVKQNYNTAGRPVISRLVDVPDVLTFTGFTSPSDVEITVFPITPETWNLDAYSRAIEIWAQMLVSSGDRNNVLPPQQ